MNTTTNLRQIAIIAGVSYWVIFFAAIFANFMVIEALTQAPLTTVQQHPLMI